MKKAIVFGGCLALGVGLVMVGTGPASFIVGAALILLALVIFFLK